MRIRWQRALTALAVVAALASLMGCPQQIPEDGDYTTIGTVLDADITTARTLDGTYTITDDIAVSAVLTIKPGTTLRFAPDTSLTVSATGSILADGTAGGVITFTSAKTATAVGDWAYIWIQGNASLFDYCIFEYADTAVELDSSATFTNCTFRYNTTGLDARAAGDATVVTSNTFLSNGEPLVINALFAVDASNTFTSNTKQRIYFFGGSVVAALAWSETEVPYYISSELTVEDHLTIAAGATLAFADDEDMNVTVTGIVTADGASGTPITFTSAKTSKAKGDWAYVWVQGNGSVFDYCVLEYSDEGLYLDTNSITITNCTFQHNTVGVTTGATTWTGPGSNTFNDNTTNILDV